MYQYQDLIKRRIQLEKAQKRKELKIKLTRMLFIAGIAIALFSAGYFTAKIQARNARMEAYAKAHGCTWQWDMSGRILPADEAYICK